MNRHAPPWWRAPWPLAAALYVGLALAYSRPLLPLLNAALPNDTGDPGLNTWILWWNAHAVPLTAKWWDGPIFFPAHGSMALSETFLNLLPISTPLQWAGASAVLTYNILFLLSFPAAALAAHGLARRLTGRHDAALIAGLAFGFAPYRAAQMPHLQMLWSCWMPLGLLALHAYLADRKARYLWLFALSWLMNGLATGYYLFFFSVLAGLWLVWFARTLRDWFAIGLAVSVASLPLVPLLVGYQHYQAAFGLTRSTQEIETFSADLKAIWATAPTIWPHRWTFAPGPEGEMYPGATILALTIAGALVAWWRAGLRGLVQAWRRRSPLMFYSIAAVLMLTFALGPVARAVGTPFLHRAPYYWLMQLPGGHAFRVPARFAMLFALCLAQAAALGFTRLIGLGSRGGRYAMAAAVCLAVGMEGFVGGDMGIAKVPAPIDLAGLDRGAVVLDLPLVDDYSDTAAMLRATQTGHALVNGFSGYVPPHYNLLREGLAAFDDSALKALQQFGPLLVFVHQGADSDPRVRDLVGDLPDAHRVLNTSEGTLFQLPPRHVAPTETDRQLSIVAIDANSVRLRVPALIDGDISTRWVAPFPQLAGTQVMLTLDRPAALSRFELDLGELKDDYLRKLRLSVGDPGQPPVKVWEGRTTGTAMIAALTDRQRMPLVFDLAPVIRGRQLILTVLDDHPERPWSIAELKVFGH